MNAPVPSQPGVVRRWSSAVVLVALSFAAIFVVRVAVAQTEAKDPTDQAIQPTQTRLPDDQPKLAPSPATSPNATALPAATAAQPNETEMMKQMMAMAKLNDNHKLLASLDGTWSYSIKFSPAPGAPEQVSTGTAVRKSLMGGRYFQMDVSGKMKMPDADGKVKDVDFKGTGIEGYDNAKQKFVAIWFDNMSTGMLMSEGAYDAAHKTLTYTGEYQPMPGMTQKVREVMKLTDKDHILFEWYEDRGGQENKTMEINYTRKK